MAGMDWFRWHHGSVTDPKFQLVARKTKSRVADVIAVWAFILESASQSDDRGAHGDLDFESIDCALGLADGQALAIHTAMIDRAMVTDDGRVAAWEKRQPKREREDDNSTERSKALRMRRRQSEPGDAEQHQTTPESANSNHATPCNAMQRQETPRVEESRVEKSKKTVCVDLREAATTATTPPADAAHTHFLPEYRQVIQTARPDLAPDAVWAAFCEHYPPPKRGLERWRKWVAAERSPAVPGVDLAAPPSVADPDSKASIEAVALARGMQRWDAMLEPWSSYKIRVKTACRSVVLQ